MFAQNPGTGFTIWITGMHASGKRSLAREVTNRLKRLEKPVENLDTPEWEVFLGKGPGDTKEERNALSRRAGFVARGLTRAGGFVVVPQISPYREVREALRREIGRFCEVFVDCPIETLLVRDTKGEYRKAMQGEIRNFIGITDPYEPPGAPEVRYDSSKQSIDDGATLIIEALVREGALTPADAGLLRAPRKPEVKKGGRKPAPPANILFTAEQLVLPKPQPRPEPRPVAAKAPAAAVKPSTVPAKPAAPSAKPAAPAAKAVPGKAVAAAPAPKAPAKAAVPAKAAPAKAAPAPVAKAAAKPAKVDPKAAKKAAPAPAPAKAGTKAAPKVAAKSAPKKIAAKTARAPGKR